MAYVSHDIYCFDTLSDDISDRRSRCHDDIIAARCCVRRDDNWFPSSRTKHLERLNGLPRYRFRCNV
jgi:hypothetical protein